MAIVGLLVLAAAIAVGAEVVVSNDVTVQAEIFGWTTANATTTAFLLFGALLALVAILGLFLATDGIGRRRRRRAAVQEEMQDAERTTDALVEENDRLRGELVHEQLMRDTMGGVAVPPGVGDVPYADQVTDAVRSSDTGRYEPYPTEPPAVIDLDGEREPEPRRTRRHARRV